MDFSNNWVASLFVFLGCSFQFPKLFDGRHFMAHLWAVSLPSEPSLA